MKESITKLPILKPSLMTYWRMGLLTFVSWLFTHSMTMGQYYISVLYNSYNQALITKYPLKFKKSADAQACISHYMQTDLAGKRFYFTLLGPYPSEADASRYQEEQRILFTQHGFSVDAIQPASNQSSVPVQFTARPIEFGHLPFPDNGASRDNRIVGYLQTIDAQLKIRVYAQTVSGSKGVLLYEGWLIRGGLVRLVTQTGRIAYNYKNTESEMWSGNIYIECQGAIEQAVPVP